MDETVKNRVDPMITRASIREHKHDFKKNGVGNDVKSIEV